MADNFIQQAADTLMKLTGRAIVGISVNPQSNDKAIRGLFQTQEGEKFAYELLKEGDQYRVTEQKLEG